MFRNQPRRSGLRTALRSSRAFTLLELMAALASMGVLIMAMGYTLVFLARAMVETEDDNTAQNRLELVRLLTNDFRSGSLIAFPATDGTTGAWVAGGFQGQAAVVLVNKYEPIGQVTTPVLVRWSSRTPTAAPSLFVLTRDESTDGGLTWNTSFEEGNILIFNVLRVDDNRIDIGMTTLEGTQIAEMLYSVGLRNVP